MNHALGIARGLLVALGVLAVAPAALSYSFVPDQSEWVTWPGYCQARYVTTDVGKRSQFRDGMSASTVNYWKEAIGHEAFLHIHHYCAGIIYLQRAVGGVSKEPRGYLLDRALAEATYTYRNIGLQNPMVSRVASTMANALLEMERLDEASALVRELIESQPESPQPYVVGAVVYHRAGQLDRALDLLKRGEQAVEEPSAEFNYTMGLVLVDLGRFEDARTYAKLAYQQGYPLPGLKNRLERAGF